MSINAESSCKFLEFLILPMLFKHSWAQRKLSPLNPLNILLSINGPLLSLGFNRLTINRSNLQKLTINAFNGLKKFND